MCVCVCVCVCVCAETSQCLVNIRTRLKLSPSLKAVNVFKGETNPNGLAAKGKTKSRRTLESIQSNVGVNIYDLCVSPLCGPFPPMTLLSTFMTFSTSDVAVNIYDLFHVDEGPACLTR